MSEFALWLEQTNKTKRYSVTHHGGPPFIYSVSDLTRTYSGEDSITAMEN
jgi:hypothetical protein